MLGAINSLSLSLYFLFLSLSFSGTDIRRASAPTVVMKEEAKQEAWESTPDALSLLRNDPSLRSLEIRNGNIGHRGATLIAHSLTTNTHITLLDLSHNTIGDDGKLK